MRFLKVPQTNPRNQVTAVGAPATVPTGDNIGVAAKALSDASYPFLKEAQGSEGHFWGVIVIVFLFAGDAWEVNWEFSSVMFCLRCLFMAMPCLLPSCLFIVIIEQNAECWIARLLLVCTAFRWTGCLTFT